MWRRLMSRLVPERAAAGSASATRREADGQPDPGEVVWGWVPYEDDPQQGKDRPVLLLGRESADGWLGLMLTSQDHDRDAADEAVRPLLDGRRHRRLGPRGPAERGAPRPADPARRGRRSGAREPRSTVASSTQVVAEARAFHDLA